MSNGQIICHTIFFNFIYFRMKEVKCIYYGAKMLTNYIIICFKFSQCYLR